MVMVPESEYFALMNMLKGGGGDPLQGEKALLDAKIQKNLSDTRTSADVQAKRHSWLYKRRQQLKDIVENRPQKVVIENPMAIPNIAPYMGIQKTKTKLEADETENWAAAEDADLIKKRPVRRKILKKTPTQTKKQNGYTSTNGGSNTEYASAGENNGEQKTPTTSYEGSKKKILTITDKASPKNYGKIITIIGRNPEKYGVEKGSGRILTNFNKPIIGSDYMQAIKYMTGQERSPPRGHTFFLQKISKDPEIKNLFIETHQQGKGKRRKKRKFVLIKLSSIKTPGLEREQPNVKNNNNKIPFKPILWTKL